MPKQPNNVMTTDRHLRKWRILAPTGLLLVGAGLSVVGTATIEKARRAPWWKWASVGTAGLAITNAGLSMFGDSVKHRALYEWATEQSDARADS